MGLNYRKKISLQKEKKKICTACNITYSEDAMFCSNCGQKLESITFETYANLSKGGITSFSCKSPSGTINSKGNITVPLGNGMSFTSSLKTKKTTPKKRKV